MGHDHSHDHSQNFNTAFAIGIALNTAYVLFEVVFGVMGHSLALLADAGHNLSDVLGLLLAWAASAITRSLPTKRRTYGLRGSSILAALFNAIFLLVSVGAIVWEALRRFRAPAEVAASTIIWVSLVGIAVNTATALMFRSGREHDLNIRGAFLHMAADAAISAGVVIAGFAILWTGWHWIDPMVSLLISAVIVWGTWDLLRESTNLALQAVPRNIEPEKVERYLAQLPGVSRVHDLHIWAMSTTETALTAHLVKPDGNIDDELLARVCDELQENFHIGHVTIQLECGSEAHPCRQAADHAV